MNDTISRKAAIEAVERYLKRLEDKIGTSDDSEMFAHERGLLVGLKFDIDNIPSAESQRWIHVAERLPDKMGTYLVTLDYKEHGTGVMSLWFNNEEIGWDLRVADEVTAWMPLPRPYEEKK